MTTRFWLDLEAGHEPATARSAAELGLSRLRSPASLCKSLSCYLVYLQFKNCLSCVRLERASYTLQAVRRRAVNPRQRWREHNFARVQLHQLLLLLLRLQLLLVVVKVKRSCRLRGGERAAAVVLRRHGRV